MTGRTIKIQLAVFALISIVGIAYAGANYVGVPQQFGGRRYTVTAHLRDSGGIFSNAEVTYRGVSIGRVGELQLTERGVDAELLINRDVRVPSDAVALVRNRSAVGEQYIDLRPQRDSAPFLHDGGDVSQPRTGTPTSTTTLLVNLDKLVDSVGKDDLTTVIVELDKAFRDTGPDLQRLVDSGNTFIEEADKNLPQTRALIHDGKTVLDTQRESSESIKSFSQDLADLSDQLARSDADLRGTLDHGMAASIQLNDLVRRIGPDLPVLLDNLISTGQVTAVRQSQLEQVLVEYPAVLEGSFTVVPDDGTAHFGLVLNADDPPACTAGYEETKRRYPQNGQETAAPRNSHCQSGDPNIAVRGTRHVPRPEETTSGSDSQSNSESESGLPLRGVASSGGQTGTDVPLAGQRQRPQRLANQHPQLGSYLMALGSRPALESRPNRWSRSRGVDGTRESRPTGSGERSIVVGSPGDGGNAFGEDSWKWLILGPLGL